MGTATYKRCLLGLSVILIGEIRLLTPNNSSPGMCADRVKSGLDNALPARACDVLACQATTQRGGVQTRRRGLLAHREHALVTVVRVASGRMAEWGS